MNLRKITENFASYPEKKVCKKSDFPAGRTQESFAIAGRLNRNSIKGILDLYAYLFKTFFKTKIRDGFLSGSLLLFGISHPDLISFGMGLNRSQFRRVQKMKDI